MRRIRIDKPKVRREPSWLDAFPLGVFPLDLRYADIVRAKAIDRSVDRGLARLPFPRQYGTGRS